MDEALSANESLALSDTFDDRALEHGFFSRGLALEDVEPAVEESEPKAVDDAQPEEPRSPRWLVAISVCLLLAVLSAGVIDAVPGLLNTVRSQVPHEERAADPSVVTVTR